LHGAAAVSETGDLRLSVMLTLRGKAYQLTVTRESFRLASKRGRKVELPWTAFVDDDAAMLGALHSSIRKRLRRR